MHSPRRWNRLLLTAYERENSSKWKKFYLWAILWSERYGLPARYFFVFSKYNASPHLRLSIWNWRKTCYCCLSAALKLWHSASRMMCRNDIEWKWIIYSFILCSILCKNQESGLQHDSGYRRCVLCFVSSPFAGSHKTHCTIVIKHFSTTRPGLQSSALSGSNQTNQPNCAKNYYNFPIRSREQEKILSVNLKFMGASVASGTWRSAFLFYFIDSPPFQYDIADGSKMLLHKNPQLMIFSAPTHIWEELFFCYLK